MSVYFTAASTVKEGEDLQFTINRTGNDLYFDQHFEILQQEVPSFYSSAATRFDFTYGERLDLIHLKAGEIFKSVSIRALNDNLQEAPEAALWKIVGSTTVANPFASTTVYDNPAKSVTLRYIDPVVEATEGQNLVIRMQLDNGNHGGFTYRPGFTNANGNQFLQSDVVGASERSNYIFPSLTFAPGQTYGEIRLGTVRDNLREGDESVKLIESKTFLTDQNLNLQVIGTPDVIIYDANTAPVNSAASNSLSGNTNAGFSTTSNTNTPIINGNGNTVTINNITNNYVGNQTNTQTVATINQWAQERLTGRTVSGGFKVMDAYDFYNLGNGEYGMREKGNGSPLNNPNGIDKLTGATPVQFRDTAVSLSDEIARTFNLVKGMDDISGVMYRMYKGAFNRLPDANGLENWINGNSPAGGMTPLTSAKEFVASQEFKQKYGQQIGDTQFVNQMYRNVLGRDADAGGLANYQGLLANGRDRGSVLMDFSESPENRQIFSQQTGLI